MQDTTKSHKRHRATYMRLGLLLLVVDPRKRVLIVAGRALSEAQRTLTFPVKALENVLDARRCGRVGILCRSRAERWRQRERRLHRSDAHHDVVLAALDGLVGLVGDGLRNTSGAAVVDGRDDVVHEDLDVNFDGAGALEHASLAARELKSKELDATTKNIPVHTWQVAFIHAGL